MSWLVSLGWAKCAKTRVVIRGMAVALSLGMANDSKTDGTYATCGCDRCAAAKHVHPTTMADTVAALDVAHRRLQVAAFASLVTAALAELQAEYGERGALRGDEELMAEFLHKVGVSPDASYGWENI